jgi:hypothetical protein
VNAEKKPPTSIRILGLVLALGLLGWGLYDQVIARY